MWERERGKRARERADGWTARWAAEVKAKCWQYDVTYRQRHTQTQTKAHTHTHTITHTDTLFPSRSHPHTLDCKNFWTAQMYCIQMHFQRVALKLAALSPRLTLTHSLSLLLEVLGQNSQVLLFNSNFFYISHTRKGSHKKVNVQKFSTKPKVMLGIIRNWIRLRYRGWFPPPPSISLFLLLLACKCSFHFPSVTPQHVSHIEASCFPSPLELQLQPGQLSVRLQLQLKSSTLTLAWQHVCVCKEVEGVCRTP